MERNYNPSDSMGLWSKAFFNRASFSVPNIGFDTLIVFTTLTYIIVTTIINN